MKDKEKQLIWLGAMEMHLASMKEDLIQLETFFFWLTRVNPGQSIWPVTRSLDRVGFQNYDINFIVLELKQQ